ncbi:hypothetical protein GTR02_21240 [Kineococcus sp. R8]|uniref:hypothetical protein n=1 Tax=Kineococcus siccus TaxID=2696567 RepID=UPI001412C528|nr:hypothetical protein [Kineococcus siccus]NAZ84331.1 hypothetical protein [Kineococcus siccus]
MPSSPPSLADRALLRRGVLAVSVLDDVDVDLDDDGLWMPGCAPLSWAEVALATTGPAVPGVGREDVVRFRVRDLLLAHRALHRQGARRVALGLPTTAVGHLGRAWRSTRVLGGAVDLGPGVVVDWGNAERVLAVPAVSAAATGADPALTAADRRHLEAMGALVVERLARDAGHRGQDLLRPAGGCDVPTLLTSSTLREHLVCGPDRSVASVLRAVAVPVRTRGWFDLARIDPAFVGAAWSATDPADRGFPRALLVTRDEVALAPSDPHLGEAALRN